MMVLWHDPEILVPAGVTTVIALNGFWFAVLKWFSGRIVKSMDDRLATVPDIDKRLIKVEASLCNQPQCNQHTEHMANMKALNLRLDAISSKVDKVIGKQEGLGRAVDLMNQFLIEQGGKK
jgi:hypothetical protein